MAANMYRVFKGFRALLASPAASSSSLLSAMSAAKFCTNDAVPDSLNLKIAQMEAEKTATGKSKVAPVSPALAQFLGAQQASLSEAVKQISSYINSQNLYNPENKEEIFCDEMLKTIFDGKEKVCIKEIWKLLARHFVKTN